MAWEELDLFQRELCLQGKWQQVTLKRQEPAKSEGKSSLLPLRGSGSGQVVGGAYTTRGGTLHKVSPPRDVVWPKVKRQDLGPRT